MIKLTYEEVYIDTVRVIEQLRVKNIFRPIVAPILRGGKYPGDIIANFYGTESSPIKYTTRHGVKENNLDDWVLAVLARPNSHPIILVDDLIDTGETLIAINEKLVEYGLDLIYNCVLHRKVSSPGIPNLIYSKEHPDTWLVYPWPD